MGKRQLITSATFTAIERQQLATAILGYVDEPVRFEHANGHNWHHAGSPEFFDGHRQYIGKLESALVAQGLGKFVPLPKWDPATTIPVELRDVKMLPAVTMRGLGSQIANPSPGLPMPGGLANLLQFPTVSALSASPALDTWHFNVHQTVGNVMADQEVSPCAAIFWLWHGFIDDIYEDWLEVPFRWIGTDLTSSAGGAPTAGDPVAYLTDFVGQGPTARVVSRPANGQIYELADVAATPGWASADLTKLAGGAAAAGDPIAYVTEFPVQGPTARVVYRAVNGQIYELADVAATPGWGSASLTQLTGTLAAAGDPIAYMTDFGGQGPTARVVFRAANGDVCELSCRP
jgi:hypothetical protein